MTEEFLEASLIADRKNTESLIGLKISPDWFEEKTIMTVRLGDYRSDAEYSNWGLHAIGLKETSEMVGYIGFHTCPNPEYLEPLARNAIEVGYTVFSKHRRRGFASEAIIGLLEWAARKHPIEYFIASVSPLNAASTALVKKLEFEQIGEQMDEIDGLELIYALAVDKMPFDNN